MYCILENHAALSILAPPYGWVTAEVIDVLGRLGTTLNSWLCTHMSVSSMCCLEIYICNYNIGVYTFLSLTMKKLHIIHWLVNSLMVNAYPWIPRYKGYKSSTLKSITYVYRTPSES